MVTARQRKQAPASRRRTERPASKRFYEQALDEAETTELEGAKQVEGLDDETRCCDFAWGRC